MKILYNLASITPPKTGIGHYTQHLIEGVTAYSDIEDVVGIQGDTILNRAQLSGTQLTPKISGKIIFITKIKKYIRPFLRFFPGAYRFRNFVVKYLSKATQSNFSYTKFIYHETNYIPQLDFDKFIITVHDLSHVRYPECHPEQRVEYLNRELTKALQKSLKIIAVSEFSRQEILSCFGINPDKVITVLLGVDKQFYPRKEEDINLILDKYSINYHGYILSVCTIEPRKNLVRLIKAFSLLPMELRKKYPLVLVGGQGWHNAEILNVAKPLLSSGELIFAGYISEEELPCFFAGAKIFAYPSLYEGFGLPVLEAMASGVPVLTSNVSSLPEVSAGAALEVDPLSTTEIFDALLHLLENEDLANQCIVKGLERAKLLTWERCVEKTIEVYRSVQLNYL